MKKICEVLGIESDILKSDEMKLLIGDMELSYSEFISCVKYSSEDDSVYNKRIGEIRAYLNCLIIFRIISKQQREQMYVVLDEMEDLRNRNKKFYQNK